jgi:FAD/FMN-containing dehydrogenase
VLPLLAEARRAAADSMIAFELIPRLGLERVTRRYGIAAPLPDPTDDLVLIKLAAAHPVVDALAALLADAASHALVSDAVVAASAEQEERLWRIRDELPIYRLFEHQAIALKNDTAIPVERTTDFLAHVRRLVERSVPGTLTYAFGHIGDGNLHVAVLPDDGDDPAPFLARRDALREQIDDLTFRLGGTLSAEHGIGRDLVTRIRPQKPAIEWELMRTIKSALDPSGSMNPGAMMPE